MRDAGKDSGLQATNEVDRQSAKEVGPTTRPAHHACHLMIPPLPFACASPNGRYSTKSHISRYQNCSKKTGFTYGATLLGIRLVGSGVEHLILQPGTLVLVLENSPCDGDGLVLPFWKPFVVLEILSLQRWMKNYRQNQPEASNKGMNLLIETR